MRFKDTKGRDWSCEVTTTTLKRVKSLCDVQLVDTIGGPLAHKLAADPVLLCEVLTAVVKPQLEAAGVSDDEFGDALSGDVLEGAVMALLEGVIEFLPKAKRPMLRKMLLKARQIEAANLDAIDRQIDALNVEQLAGDPTKSGDSSTNSPDTSDSTPAPSP